MFDEKIHSWLSALVDKQGHQDSRVTEHDDGE